MVAIQKRKSDQVAKVAGHLIKGLQVSTLMACQDVSEGNLSIADSLALIPASEEYHVMS